MRKQAGAHVMDFQDPEELMSQVLKAGQRDTVEELGDTEMARVGFRYGRPGYMRRLRLVVHSLFIGHQFVCESKLLRRRHTSFDLAWHIHTYLRSTPYFRP